jgi:hypothetical protein
VDDDHCFAFQALELVRSPNENFGHIRLARRGVEESKDPSTG